jgi:hypothetical protein
MPCHLAGRQGCPPRRWKASFSLPAPGLEGAGAHWVKVKEPLQGLFVPKGDERYLTRACPCGERHYVKVFVIRACGGGRWPRAAVACRHLRLRGTAAHEKRSRGQSKETGARIFHDQLNNKRPLLGKTILRKGQNAAAPIAICGETDRFELAPRPWRSLRLRK